MGWHNLAVLIVPLGFAAAIAACLLANRPITRRSALLACLAVLVSALLAVSLAWGGAAGRSPLWLTGVVLAVCALVYLAALATLAAIAMTGTDHGVPRAHAAGRRSNKRVNQTNRGPEADQGSGAAGPASVCRLRPRR
jgi:hypothetical protein